jgi:hypothetical protein
MGLEEQIGEAMDEEKIKKQMRDRISDYLMQKADMLEAGAKALREAQARIERNDLETQ